MTPLVRAPRLAKRLGLAEVWVKNDAVSYPTLSFKDRVVSVAVSKAIEFGIGTIACASTGNLANATAAQAAAAGLPAVVLIPYDLEPAKVIGTSIYGARVVGVKGTYDDVNRLCSEIAGKYGWGFVNVNLRPFYAEGSKAYAYEIAEQLGWRLPAHIVVPMAGGSLVTKIGKAFGEFEKLGLVAAPGRKPRIHGAQAAGCAPIIDMVLENRDQVRPVKKPTTIAKSLAIGNPADGFYARQTIIGSGGWAAKPDDEEILSAMSLLAETEGIFTETAGGVTLAAAIEADRRRADRQGRRAGGHLHHRQRPEDAGPAGRPAAAAEADRPAPGRFRRAASDLDLKERLDMATIRIPTPLRKLTQGKEEVTAAGATVGALIASLETQYPGIKERICDDSGQVRRFVNIFANDEDIRFLKNLDTPVKDSDEISIVPAIAGGR